MIPHLKQLENEAIDLIREVCYTNDFSKIVCFYSIGKDSSFVRQHDIQLLPDGRLLMFDNHISSLSAQESEYHHVSFPYQWSKILILGLDEKHKKVTSVQTIPLNFQAPYMGSVQKISDNRWFVGCGSSSTCTARMQDSEGNILWQMKANDPYKMYRAYYYDTLR